MGEPYWRQDTAETYLRAMGQERDAYGTHAENVEAAQRQGLELAYTLVSSSDDWDRYEGLRWYAAQRWASTHPEDPDVKVVLECVRRNRAAYLRWGRDALGWAVYLFRTGAPALYPDTTCS